MWTQVVRGVPITFPYTPYDVQVTFMERVIEALQECKDALLESPTGTGKTMCLLAATLAWREQFALSEAARGSSEPLPKIIYASRTHSQLSKVIAELKHSSFQPRMTVMGSRQQLCIHSKVEAANAASKTGACRTLVNAGNCRYYDAVQAEVATIQHQHVVLDIEDMVSHGRQHNVCPYYLARERCTTADIAFMPYNYLIDSSIRKVLHSQDLNGSVLIFDEAHNLDAVCADAASFELKETELVDAIVALRRLTETGMLEESATELCHDVINRASTLLVRLKACCAWFCWAKLPHINHILGDDHWRAHGCGAGGCL